MIDQRNKPVTFGSAMGNFFSGFINFSGYSTRTGYWIPAIFIRVIYFLLSFIIAVASLGSLLTSLLSSRSYYGSSSLSAASGLALAGTGGIVLIILSLIYFIFSIGFFANAARRLRDAGLANGAISVILILSIFFDILIYVSSSTIIAVFWWLFAIFYLVLVCLPSNSLVTYKTDELSKFLFRYNPNANPLGFVPYGHPNNTSFQNNQGMYNNGQGVNNQYMQNPNGQNINNQQFNPNGQNINNQQFNPNGQNINNQQFNPNGQNINNQQVNPNGQRNGNFNGGFNPNMHNNQPNRNMNRPQQPTVNNQQVSNINNARPTEQNMNNGNFNPNVQETKKEEGQINNNFTKQDVNTNNEQQVNNINTQTSINSNIEQNNTQLQNNSEIKKEVASQNNRLQKLSRTSKKIQKNKRR